MFHSLDFPNITAFTAAQIKLLLQFLRHIAYPFQSASNLPAYFPAWFVIRVACNHHRGFPAVLHFTTNQPARPGSKVIPPVGRIDVITDMPVIEYRRAFTVPV